MTGTYLSERHGDTYQLWYIDATGDRELIAVGTCDPDQIAHRIADLEADHRRMTEVNDRCRRPLSHRYKHNCPCICALPEGHEGRHQCKLEADQ